MSNTLQSELDLYLLIRNVRWQYELDDANSVVAERVRVLLEELHKVLSGHLGQYSPSDLTAQRIDKILAEIREHSEAVANQLTNLITLAGGMVGTASLTEHYNTLSLDGAAEEVESPGAISAAEFGLLLASAYVGGKILREWVKSALDVGVEQRLREAVESGLFQSEESRTAIYRVVREGTNISIQGVSELAQSYLHTSSEQAREVVIQANSGLVKQVQWSAILEPGNKQTGRGTCLRCAALDGQRWTLAEERPPCPLHVKCRCFWLPVLDWAALGLPEMDMSRIIREYTNWYNEPNDYGGNRMVIEIAKHEGDYASWLAKQDDFFKINAMGPKRFELYQQGATLGDFVNRKTGELFTLKELEASDGRRR